MGISDLIGMLSGPSAQPGLIDGRKKYNEYVIAQQMQGQDFLPFEQWMQQQGGQPASPMGG